RCPRGDATSPHNRGAHRFPCPYASDRVPHRRAPTSRQVTGPKKRKPAVRRADRRLTMWPIGDTERLISLRLRRVVSLPCSVPQGGPPTRRKVAGRKSTNPAVRRADRRLTMWPIGDTERLISLRLRRVVSLPCSVLRAVAVLSCGSSPAARRYQAKPQGSSRG